MKHFFLLQILTLQKFYVVTFNNTVINLLMYIVYKDKLNLVLDIKRNSNSYKIIYKYKQTYINILQSSFSRLKQN